MRRARWLRRSTTTSSIERRVETSSKSRRARRNEHDGGLCTRSTTASSTKRRRRMSSSGCEAQLERSASARQNAAQSTVPKRGLIENSGASGSGEPRQHEAGAAVRRFLRLRPASDRPGPRSSRCRRWLTLIELLVGEVPPASQAARQCNHPPLLAGRCIPPHIDRPSFERPFCALSLGSSANILFGKDRHRRPGRVYRASLDRPPAAIRRRLPGTAGNKVQHCIPAVASRRISITFRRCPPNVRAKLGLK